MKLQLLGIRLLTSLKGHWKKYKAIFLGMLTAIALLIYSQLTNHNLLQRAIASIDRLQQFLERSIDRKASSLVRFCVFEIFLNHCFSESDSRKVLVDMLPLQSDRFRSSTPRHEQEFHIDLLACVVISHISQLG